MEILYLILHKWTRQVISLFSVPTWRLIYNIIIHSGCGLAWLFMKERVKQMQSCPFHSESSKFPKSWTLETSILKFAVCPLIIHNFQLPLDRLYINRKTYYNLPNSAFWGWLSMESKPHYPESRNNPENFHAWENQSFSRNCTRTPLYNRDLDITWSYGPYIN